MRRLACIAFVASCGDNAVVPADAGPIDAPPVDALGACTATFSSDFAELVTLPTDCAMLSVTGALAFAIPSVTRSTTFSLAFDLGDAAPGTYSSESLFAWSAMAVELLGFTECVFDAGATAVPPGSFTLTLTAAGGATAHGHLALELAVLSGAEVDCGPTNTELLDLVF
jgi:hypothetical protein